ncbi:endoplasmic reticulum junction formation protein lunapark isoform X2 [Copidosoma floridanum]|uniref:endoplasmic reticulum junction formation protein lunapark isoform X2 n=1 Tax=Copidosoma floridanum TaxID=29053 RepID=UPI0006C98875|nr:endoplasmic reticulum junction formation protein lunapark isoform X2 [Copidosoma floridanum]
MEQRHKKIVGFLIIYSGILYIITTMIFYFYFFPAELYDQIFYIAPLLTFPILILFTKKTVSWYYRRKIFKYEEKLTNLQHEKKKVLDEVTETETYKKAKEILMKYAPDQLQTALSSRHSLAPSEISHSSTPQILTSLQSGSELRRRALASSTLYQNASNTTGICVPIGVSSGQTLSSLSPYLVSKSNNTATSVPKSPLPRPILPKKRSYIDKLVEYVVGDGPNNRYALICQKCDSHNGMALKEEFEYFAFRCCYCNFWNPARKQKPSAPKLDVSGTPQRLYIKHEDRPTDDLLKVTELNNEISANASYTETVKKLSTTSDGDRNTFKEDMKKLSTCDQKLQNCNTGNDKMEMDESHSE